MEVNEDMDRPRLTPETLAGLLAGTLTPEERGRALEVIARSPADYEAFAEASAVMDSTRDLPGGEIVTVGTPGGAPVVPLRPRTARRWMPWALAAAAVLAIGYAIRPAAPDGPTVLADLGAVGTALVRPGEPLDQRFGPGWLEPLPGTRGGAGAPSVAFRAGVAFADFQVAVAGGDSAAIAAAAQALIAPLGEVPGGGPAAAAVAAAAADPVAARAGNPAAGPVTALLGRSSAAADGFLLETLRLSARAGALRQSIETEVVRSALAELRTRGDSALANRLAALVDHPAPAGVLREMIDSMALR